MTMEWSVVDRPAYFTRDERWWFRQTQKPLSNTKAWIIGIKCGEWSWRNRDFDLAFPTNIVIRNPDDPPVRVFGISRTMHLFFLAFQLTHVRNGKLPSFAEEGWDEGAFQMWPIDSAQEWPPLHLEKTQFRAFAQRWKNTERLMKGLPRLPSHGREH